MSGPAEPVSADAVTATGASVARAGERRLVAVLSVTETISWGIVYYVFAVVLPAVAISLSTSQTAVSGALAVAVTASAVAGVPVGRHLDRHGPRRLMTVGSIAAVLLVLAWSQVTSVLWLYVVWTAIGVVMAAILYEPAFVVLAKWVLEPAARRRAMTSVTLAAALASFIFVPLAQALQDDFGWRTALVVLAGVLAVTIPLHLLLPGGAPPVVPASLEDAAPRRGGVRAVLRRTDFRRLTAGYFLANFAGIAPLVVLIPFLVDRGYSAGFSAFALGCIGAAQIPGRLLFALVARRLPGRQLTPTIFVLVGAGLVIVLLAPNAALVLLGTVVLGMGNGMTTLARATDIADRFGTALYGAVSSVTAAATTLARALGPVAATAIVAALSTEALFVMLTGCALVAAAATARLGSPDTAVAT